MATFEGTIQEFHHFIGPRIRNAINNLTRKYRKNLNGICEDCGQKKELHSAHVHGRERRAIIKTILDPYVNNGIIHCNIEETENKILNAHLPIENCFKFLCHNCHVTYDSNTIITKPTRKSAPLASDQNKEREEIKKVKRKIPRWFKNTHQINSRILVAFLTLKNNNIHVTPTVLREHCSEINDFKGNYNQMKNFGEKNHAKVFEEINNTIELWKPVEDFIFESYKAN